MKIPAFAQPQIFKAACQGVASRIKTVKPGMEPLDFIRVADCISRVAAVAETDEDKLKVCDIVSEILDRLKGKV